MKSYVSNWGRRILFDYLIVFIYTCWTIIGLAKSNFNYIWRGKCQGSAV